MAAIVADYGLAMDLDDLRFCRDYFRSEDRDPTITELRVIDTYWSDHCRHTTFLTTIDAVEFQSPILQQTYEDYLNTRKRLGRTKPVNLMDIGTIVAKYLKKAGEDAPPGRVRGGQRLHGEDQGGHRPRQGRTGSFSLRTKPTTTPRRLSPSAAQPPAWAAPSGTPSPAGPMSTPPCA